MRQLRAIDEAAARVSTRACGGMRVGQGPGMQQAHVLGLATADPDLDPWPTPVTSTLALTLTLTLTRRTFLVSIDLRSDSTTSG